MPPDPVQFYPDWLRFGFSYILICLCVYVSFPYFFILELILERATENIQLDAKRFTCRSFNLKWCWWWWLLFKIEYNQRNFQKYFSWSGLTSIEWFQLKLGNFVCALYTHSMASKITHAMMHCAKRSYGNRRGVDTDNDIECLHKCMCVRVFLCIGQDDVSIKMLPNI